jgi:hypothetical protein
MNKAAEILIEGIFLVFVGDGGNCLAHWIRWSTDCEIVDAMRKWADAEITQQAAKMRLEAAEQRRASMHVVKNEE